MSDVPSLPAGASGTTGLKPPSYPSRARAAFKDGLEAVRREGR